MTEILLYFIFLNVHLDIVHSFILPMQSIKKVSPRRMMSLIPLEKEIVEQIITQRLPTPAQYATYWGRTSREQYNAAFESFGVSFLGVFGAYFLSFTVGSFVATILGMIAGFWVLLGPEIKAYQRNWELTGGREIVDPWTDDGSFDFRSEDKRGLYGALYFGRISHIAVVEDQFDPPEDEYDLEDFLDYTMGDDEMERLSGIPYQLRLRVTDDPYHDYGKSGRELQIHTRMSEEYLNLDRGMPVCALLFSPSQSFLNLASITDFCVPDAGPCYIGDYPYLDRAAFEELFVTDDDLWDMLRSEGRGKWDISTVTNGDYPRDISDTDY